MLSIVIPTYNRNEKVLRLLKKIESINTEYKLSVVVIDNNSEVSTEDFLLSENYHYGKEVKIIRNNGNVGLGGNLINSFMHCQTEWMWLLGDDDLPLDDSIEIILKEIKNTNDKDFLIKFNSSAGQFPTQNTVINNIDSLIDFNSDFGYYSNMMFISNAVFRTSVILKETFYMSGSIKTMAPHLVGVYRCVEKGFSIKIVNNFIIEHGIPESEQDKWDYERLIIGLLCFIDADINLKIKEKLLPKLFLRYVNGEKLFFRRLLVYPYRSLNGDRFFWSYFLLKSATLFSGFRFFYLILLGSIIRSKFVNDFFKYCFSHRKQIENNKDVFRN
jgi:glycosyltransferase involved in cell wall biosynthesis